MVDAARNTAWDLGKQPNNYRSNYPTQEWARRFVPIAAFYSRWNVVEQRRQVVAQLYQHSEQWGRDDSEEQPDAGGSEAGKECEEEDEEKKHEEGDWEVGERSSDSHAAYFRDGRTRVDYVLVYEGTAVLHGRGNRKKRTSSGRGDGKEGGSKKGDRNDMWRGKFMGSLQRAGLLMEEDVEVSGRRSVCFIKLSAPWPVLIHFAEELNMRAPLQCGVVTQASLPSLLRKQLLFLVQIRPTADDKILMQAHNNPATNWTEDLLKRLRLPNLMAQEVPNKPLDYFTCAFKKSKIDRFLGSGHEETYFSNTQRSRIVYEILSTAVFGKRKKGEIGIDRLVEEGVYSAAFPLHDGPYELPSDWHDPVLLNPRQVLYHYWARWGRWYKYQPLDHIREYFGEKIGIYFAWLGFYTGWLLPAAVVGLIVFLYGLVTINLNIPAVEICETRGRFKMCPLCDEELGCEHWDLNDICPYAMISYLFDHPGTVFYAIFISFWAVSFLEYWKRKSASLAHHWDSLDFQEEEERPRPEFAAKAPMQQKNPITGVREPSFPKNIRTKRIVAGVGLIFIMMSLVIIFIIAVIIYRVLVSIPLFQNEALRSQAQAISSLSGAVVNFMIIMSMGRVYTKLAYRLTNWEMHRTQTEFEDNLTFKVFIFQFVNFYSSIFYIAFCKGRFVGYPGHYKHILGLRNEDCSAGGCLIELAQQLGVIMIGKQVVNNAQEILVPKLKAWWHKKKVKMTGKGRSFWEADYGLIDNEGLFEEYLEMVLQFGFLTIFVAAFPLAPLFALLNNWVEIRLDAQKFVCETRRPVAERAQNIGIWFTILDFMAHLAVISNAFLIAFTSEFLPRLLYKYEYDWTLRGYVNFTLATAPNGTMSEECRYRGYRDQNGVHTIFFWRLLAIRLGFVIAFEHVVFGVCRLIDVLVPDVPQSLEIKIKRERYLAKQALADSENIMKVAQGAVDEAVDGAGGNCGDGKDGAEPLLPSYPQLYTPKSSIKYKQSPLSRNKESPTRASVPKQSSLYSMLLNDGSTVNCVVKDEDSELPEQPEKTTVASSEKESDSGRFSSLVFPSTMFQRKLSVSPSSSLKMYQDSSVSSSFSHNVMSPSSDQASHSELGGNYPALAALMGTLRGPNPLVKAISLTSSIPEVVAYEAQQLRSEEAKIPKPSIIRASSSGNDRRQLEGRLSKASDESRKSNSLYPRLSEESPLEATAVQNWNPLEPNVKQVLTPAEYSPHSDYSHRNEMRGKEVTDVHNTNSTIVENHSETTPILQSITDKVIEPSNPTNINASQHHVSQDCFNTNVNKISAEYEKHSQGIPEPPPRKKRSNPPKPPLRTSFSVDKHRGRDLQMKRLTRRRTLDSQSDDSCSPDTSYSECNSEPSCKYGGFDAGEVLLKDRVISDAIPEGDVVEATSLSHVGMNVPVTQPGYSISSSPQRETEINRSKSNSISTVIKVPQVPKRRLHYADSIDEEPSSSAGIRCPNNPDEDQPKLESGNVTLYNTKEIVNNSKVFPKDQNDPPAFPRNNYVNQSNHIPSIPVTATKPVPPKRILPQPLQSGILITSSLPCSAGTATVEAKHNVTSPVSASNGSPRPCLPAHQSSQATPHVNKRLQRPLRRTSAVVPPPPPPRLSKTMSEN
ncbi:Anoctamin dimerization domain [Trinorchestia longiramus]|nr:Anoctamin dimerization domain [Trinorchestia longiramus]